MKPNGIRSIATRLMALFRRHVDFRPPLPLRRTYVPLAYVVEPIVRTGSVYTLTAKTGAGKTALALIIALAVSTGRGDLLGMDVEKGRVAYLSFENADDFRMRLKVGAYLLNIDLDDLNDRFVVLDARAKPEELVKSIGRLSDAGDVFNLIVIDTFAAAFDGDDVNNNVQGGEFVRRLRPLSQLPGMPAVLIPAHPTKNASDDNLVPYGGGAILNEVDGNLSLCKRAETGSTVLHWQGKYRGLEFSPRHFRFELVSSPDVVDNRGRQVKLPVLRPVSDADAEDRAAQEANVDRNILRCLMRDNPPSLREMQAEVGRKRNAIEGRLKRLRDDKLVEQVLGKWRLTPKGFQEVGGRPTNRRKVDI